MKKKNVTDDARVTTLYSLTLPPPSPFPPAALFAGEGETTEESGGAPAPPAPEVKSDPFGFGTSNGEPDKIVPGFDTAEVRDLLELERVMLTWPSVWGGKEKFARRATQGTRLLQHGDGGWGA